MSRGGVARLAKATRYAAGSALAIVMGSTGAWAQCTTSSPVSAIIPFGQGAAINSIITSLGTVNTASLAQSTAFVGTPGNAPAESQGGGRWSRVIGGTVETNSTSTLTSTVSNWTISGAGTDNCRTTTKQDYVGTQAGMDISRLNFANGGNFHFGATAGYFDITSKDRTPGQGTFSSDTQVPFVGLYAQLNSGNFSMDAQLRGDYYHSELTDWTQGLLGQSLDAKGAAFLWNASYQFDVGKNWFVRPSVGGVWSRTEVDAINVAGLMATFPTQLTLPGTATVAPITTVLGRASVTVGGTYVSGKLALQPFATASVFHEFAGNVTTHSEIPPGLFDMVSLESTSTISRVGTYAHFGVGVAGTIVDAGWLGYVKLDVLTGDNIEGASVNAGLRYQFNPTASASLKDGGYASPTGYSWTGLYAGMLTGGVLGRGDWTDAQGPTEPRFTGFLAGGTIGYNHQFGHMVFGIEADAGIANAKGGRECPGTPSSGDVYLTACEVDQNSLSTVTARLGFAHQRALFFVKGGLAIGEVEARVEDNTNGNIVFGVPGVREDSKVLTGWTIGLGMEYAISDRWTAKAEYLHYDLGSATFQTFDDGPGRVFPADIDVTGDTVRIGLNYQFGHRGHVDTYDALK